MERYKDFIFKVSGNQEEFIKELKGRLTSKEWIVRDDMAEKAIGSYPALINNIACIETTQLDFHGKTLKAIIWINITNEKCEVTNIIPLLESHLEHSEYNFILDNFRDCFILPLSKSWNIVIEESKPYYDLVDEIGEEGVSKLALFSDMANKSTGHSHPKDFERWCDFVFSVYDGGYHLSADILAGWLEEHKWSNQMASKLSLDFEYGMSLLQEYGDRCK